ncbi:probable serine/threonine protein kinase IRE [Mercurialis annua]|uniref:probable serine/threonine protein kinase IRE n=1 Tax=Mercurialis annua TaxID=3986 RepID=UPI00215FB363|nr:probable serine/threonine protein kinase IRE [Mercurialis annua]
MSSNNQDPPPETTTSSSSTSSASLTSTSTPPKFKLRKIPPIPIRRTTTHKLKRQDETYDAEDEEDDDDDDHGAGHHRMSSQNRNNYNKFKPLDENSSNSRIIMASALGLNNIKTQLSAPSPSPSLSRFSSTVTGRPSLNLRNITNNNSNALNNKEDQAGLDNKLKWNVPIHTEPGKKIAWSQSKSLKYPSGPSPLNPALESHAFAKELQSPRFQAILRVTSNRKNKTPDVKSFSHELNSKGVRPFPVWKSRAFGHMEEVMVAIRAKFNKLKEEVDSDLGLFAGDLVGILERASDTHHEWSESLEDLLIIARQCSKMSPNEFWVKCEVIVQNLDDKRQELPMGIIKQAHTRLLFILTRCTRLVQFQKESGYEDDHVLGLHQLSDLGVYPEQIFDVATQDFSGPLAAGKVAGREKHRKKPSRDQEEDSLVVQQEHVDQTLEVNTARSGDSTTSSYKMSSWKKLPSAAEKNRKGHDAVDSPTKDKVELSHSKDETRVVEDDHSENLGTPEHPASSGMRKASWGHWGEHHNIAYGNSMICRICEVEIPIVHVEEHSLICTIADRCDLKGLTINERLERVVDTLDKILESWTPKSTPKSCDTPIRSLGVERVAGVPDDSYELSPEENSFSRHCSEDMLDLMPDVDNSFLNEDINVLPEISCEGNSIVSPDADAKSSSAGSLTPRSPLLTPRTSQIELLVTGRRTIMELENHPQISKLLDIARSVANINECDYGGLECMLDRLDDLKYAIQDRKVDALIVETFGRRIENLLQEKYVHLCAQIDDEKLDSSNHMVDEDSCLEDDVVRSLRASPINPSKDRTSIEDFEIIKPISRGAFGRVFLAMKRATGDSFAIKVLKKADMIRKNAVESILAERNILISVRNPFVVRFFYSFTCRENLYLVMEYLNGGDLYSLLRNLGCIDEDMARVYIAELVLALEYLHSLNVIHRDLKPDNLLIGQDGHLKLTDFGLSKVGLINSTDDLSGPSFTSAGMFDEQQKEQNAAKREQRRKHSVVGTPDYLAPEILLGTGHGATADWWSVGIILFELLVGIPPFNAETPQEIFDNIMNRDIPWPRVPEEMSFEACDLIDKLLTDNPLQRLGATGAKQVKQHAFFKDINWDTLARQKATFIPAADALDTSYFMSRYIWNPEAEHFQGGSDFDDLTDTCSTGSFSHTHEEEGDECGSLADFNNAPALAVKYSFSNFSFKNLSQLASINYDMVIRSARETAEAAKQSEP